MIFGNPTGSLKTRRPNGRRWSRPSSQRGKSPPLAGAGKPQELPRCVGLWLPDIEHRLRFCNLKLRVKGRRELAQELHSKGGETNSPAAL